MEYLREIGVAPPDTAAPAGPVDRLLVDYREYMVLERRFAARTVAGCERVARVFLENLEERHGGLDLDVLMAADLSESLVSESRRRNIGGMRGQRGHADLSDTCSARAVPGHGAVGIATFDSE